MILAVGRSVGRHGQSVERDGSESGGRADRGRGADASAGGIAHGERPPGACRPGVEGLDAEVVGADPLAGKLLDAQELLGAGFGIIGQALAEVAGHAAEISAVFAQADQRLSKAAETVR